MTVNVSGSIGYLFRFGSDNTCNPKYHETRSIWYLCQIQIGSVSFLSDWTRFGVLGSINLATPNFNTKFMNLYATLFFIS